MRSHLELHQHLDIDTGRAKAICSLQSLLHLLVQLVEQRLDRRPVIDVQLVLHSNTEFASEWPSGALLTSCKGDLEMHGAVAVLQKDCHTLGQFAKHMRASS